jgi:hypothetical protein
VVTLLIVIAVKKGAMEARSTLHMPAMLLVTEGASEDLVQHLGLKIIHLLISAKVLLMLRLMVLVRAILTMALILLAFTLNVVFVRRSFSKVHEIFELV